MSRRKTPLPEIVHEIVGLMPDSGIKLLRSTGPELIERLGIEAVKEVVCKVLCGENLRDSTEMLTRRKLALLNAATLVMLIRGVLSRTDFIATAPGRAAKGLRGPADKQSRWVLQWLLGLTDKAYQNVLRDNPAALEAHATQFTATVREVAASSEKEYGRLSGQLKLPAEGSIKAEWDFFVQLCGTIGSQTLAIRGSDKSLYGKLFERLILGSVLRILGFEQVPPDAVTKTAGVFWLSSRGKRESDATALCGPGKGVRFDIGFIGRGNPEISLDKVSRFERHMELGNGKYYMATFVIVDTIGTKSRIVEQAKAIDGSIIQMSASYWPRQLAKELQGRVGYKTGVGALSDERLAKLFRDKLKDMDIRPFIKGVAAEAEPSEENGEA